MFSFANPAVPAGLLSVAPYGAQKLVLREKRKGASFSNL
jgi:hypothetical protein